MAMRRKLMLYAYKDWLRKMDKGLGAEEARKAIESDYQLSDEEKAELSWPIQLELEMRRENEKWSKQIL